MLRRRERVPRKLIPLTLALLLIGVILATYRIQQATAQPKTWIVDDDGPADFSGIQEAVNASSDGDTIFVKPGSYSAGIYVAKNISIVAESQDVVINANNGIGSAIVLVAGNVSISGFTILAGDTGIMVGAGTKDEPVRRVVSRNRIMNAQDSGIFVYWSNGALITENTFVNNYYAIRTRNSNCTINRNLFENNLYGIIRKEDNRASAYSENTFKNNAIGIDLGFFDDRSVQIKIYHNNFQNNTINAQPYERVRNAWDNGYPCGGNYWSDYNGSDADDDGIGDSSYVIDEYNVDAYPLVAPVNAFDAGTWNGEIYNVDVASSFTVSDFQINETQKAMSFNVTGFDGASGFCRVIVPNAVSQGLWQTSFSVLLDDNPQAYKKWLDSANTYIYVSYTHSEHRITIRQEQPSTTSLLSPEVIASIALLVVLLIIAATIVRKRLRRKPETSKTMIH